jgi:hypothetical protein
MNATAQIEPRSGDRTEAMISSMIAPCAIIGDEWHGDRSEHQSGNIGGHGHGLRRAQQRTAHARRTDRARSSRRVRTPTTSSTRSHRPTGTRNRLISSAVAAGCETEWSGCRRFRPGSSRSPGPGLCVAFDSALKAIRPHEVPAVAQRDTRHLPPGASGSPPAQSRRALPRGQRASDPAQAEVCSASSRTQGHQAPQPPPRAH